MLDEQSSLPVVDKATRRETEEEILNASNVSLDAIIIMEVQKTDPTAASLLFTFLHGLEYQMHQPYAGTASMLVYRALMRQAIKDGTRLPVINEDIAYATVADIIPKSIGAEQVDYEGLRLGFIETNGTMFRKNRVLREMLMDYTAGIPDEPTRIAALHFGRCMYKLLENKAASDKLTEELGSLSH